MTFIRTSTTFFALIFSVQISMASGPTLLDEDAARRLLVPASQVKTEETSTASSWGRLGSLFTSVKGVFFSPQKNEESLPSESLLTKNEVLTNISWEERWEAIEKHVVKLTKNHYLEGLEAAFVMHQKLKSKPQLEDKLKSILYSSECPEDMVDKCLGTSDSKYVHDVFEWQLLEDVKSLNVAKFVGLMLMDDPDGTASNEFLQMLYNYSRFVAERRFDLREPGYFLQGQRNARLLLEMAQLEPAEDQLPDLMSKVLTFYLKQDGGELTNSSKSILNHLGIPYPAARKDSFNIPKATAAGALILLTLGQHVIGAAAQTQPTALIAGCRGTLLECLSTFKPAVGFGAQITSLIQVENYNDTIQFMQQTPVSSAYTNTQGHVSGLQGGGGIYAEVSSWNNAISPNVTRVLNHSPTTGLIEGVDYTPLSGSQHYETTFRNSIFDTPLTKTNLTTTTVARSINPYLWEFPQSGERWFLLAQPPYPNNNTLIVSEVFRPASGTPLLKSYTGMVITPQSAANRVNLAALQGAYVAPGTPSRVTSQQGITADAFEASYGKGLVASNNCASSISIQSFLAQNNINLSGLISCMQNSGYNPLSCRTFSNPLGGYVQLMNYYMMNGVELHEVVVSGSTYTHDIYTSTSASTMSRLRHTFDWKAQGAPTTTTTPVFQALSARQGTLSTNGAIRKFAVLYYGGSEPEEPANVLKVDETGTVSYGTYFGANRCGTKKRDVEEKQPQTKIESVRKVLQLNINEFQTKETYADMFWRFLGFGPSMQEPHAEMNAEDWFQFQQYGPLVDGRPLGEFKYSDETADHEVYLTNKGGFFDVVMYSQNRTNSGPKYKKWIVK